ncbi:MAG: DUF2520 domain-containing protein [Fluviicola sp.]|nr:DUF2520 domain-containing protein [Fluviicola sp.]
MKKIGIVGSGNVATHLVIAFKEKGMDIAGLFSRNHHSAHEICERFSIPYFETIEQFKQVDLIIVCVSDDALANLIPQLAQYAPTATTSGTIDVLQFDHLKDVGVFYPLQSFTTGKNVAFDTIPIFIEASSDAFAQTLKDIGTKLSCEVHFISAKQRQHLHVAAVMVNNFTNHLMTLAADYLKKENIPFEWLQPLILETVDKLSSISPYDAQTGPARRNDQQTIDRHLSLITNEELKQLYIQFTKSRQTTYNHD